MDAGRDAGARIMTKPPGCSSPRTEKIDFSRQTREKTRLHLHFRLVVVPGFVFYVGLSAPLHKENLEVKLTSLRALFAFCWRGFASSGVFRLDVDGCGWAGMIVSSPPPEYDIV